MLHHQTTGNSAFNTIERYMAPLSKAMVGTVLEHNHHGNHLDASKKTTDKELEIKNFFYGQQALSDLFNKVTIEGHNVTSEAIKPTSVQDRINKFGGKLSKRDRLFLHKHYQEGSLSFQLFKCNDRHCCRPLRSNYRQYLRTGRMTVPILLERKESGAIAAVKKGVKTTRSMFYGDLHLNERYVHEQKCFDYKQKCFDNNKIHSFRLCPPGVNHIDAYRPDITKDMAKQCICSICLQSFANKTQKENHRRAVHPRQKGSKVEDDDIRVEELGYFDIVEDDAVEIIGVRNGLHLMKYEDLIQWLSLSKDHPMVKEFENERKENDETDELPTITQENLKEWIRNKVVDPVSESDFC